MFQIILQTQNGSKVIYRDNFAIITGTIILNQEINSTIEIGQADISYPSGFTKDNCIVLSVMTRNSEQKDNIGYSYGVLADENYSEVINSSAMGKHVVLKDTSIMMTMRFNWNGITANGRTDKYNYKIILMKLPEISESEYKLGDINEDGQVTQADADLIALYTTGNISLTDRQLKAADVNKDGEISTADYMKIKQYVEGTISSF